MNERIVIGKEDPESRVGVIPPDNPVIRILLILGLVDMLPRILCEGNVSPRLRGIQTCDARFDNGRIRTFPAD